jgi:hypothetical protein
VRKLLIDGVEVVICRAEPCPTGGTRYFVKPAGVNGGPRSQHEIPSSGKFRTNGHEYEWR